MLSLSNCLIMCQRPAPSAARILISLLRESERASSRFATFTHATSRTQPAIAHNMNNAERVPPIIAFNCGKTFAPTFVFESGYCWRRAALIVLMFACACCNEMFGFNRAMHPRKSLPRCSVIGCEPSFDSRKIDIVTQSSGETALMGKENRGGIMPIT